MMNPGRKTSQDAALGRELRRWADEHLFAGVRLDDRMKSRLRHRVLAEANNPMPSRRSPGWWAASAAAFLVAVVGISMAVQQTTHPAVQTHHHVQPHPTLTLLRAPLQSIDMLTPFAGWAVTQKGQVLRTSDGGAAWLDVTPKGMPQGSTGFQFLMTSTDQSHAWVAVDSVLTFWPTVVYRTTDGGQRWQSASTGQTGALQIRFLNASTGFLLLDPQGASAGSEWVKLLRTTDGGKNWRLVADGRPNSSILFTGDKSGFGFADPENGWMTGNSGVAPILLYVTHDGGTTWHPQNLAVPNGFSAANDRAQSQPPEFFGVSDGVMPVWFFARGGTMVFYRTTDGGHTWTPTTPVGGGGGLAAYSVVDPTHIFATYGTKVYRTADGGLHWSAVQPNISLHGVTKLDFVNPSDGWAIVNGQLLRTTNGGSTWSKVGAATKTRK